MADVVARSPWLHRALFVVIVLVIMTFQLLPLETTPRRWVGPDLMVALALVWVVRRPETLPAWLLAATFLLADMLFQRPPGLWTALIVIATEWLRGQSRGLRSQGFATEWLTVAAALVGITLLNRFILALTITDLAPLWLVLVQMTMTVLVYPAVAVASGLLFGIRRPRVGDTTGTLA